MLIVVEGDCLHFFTAAVCAIKTTANAKQGRYKTSSSLKECLRYEFFVCTFSWKENKYYSIMSIMSNMRIYVNNKSSIEIEDLEDWKLF